MAKKQVNAGRHNRKKRQPKLVLGGKSISFSKPTKDSAHECFCLLDQLLSTTHTKERAVGIITKSFEQAFKIQSLSTVLPIVEDVKSEEDLQNIRFVKRQAPLLKDVAQRFYQGLTAESGNELKGSDSTIGAKLEKISDSLGIYVWGGGWGVGWKKGKKTAVCLSGGGSHGSFEAGAILYLERAGHLENVKLVTGTSVGAINALGISSWHGQAGTNIGNLWLSLRRNSDMYEESGQWSEFQDLLEANNLDFSLDGGLSGRGPDFTDDDWLTGFSVVTGGITGIIAANDLGGRIEQLGEIVEKLMELDQVYTLAPTRELLRNQLPVPSASNLPLKMVFVSARDGHPYFVDETATARKMTTRHPREFTGSQYKVVGDSLQDSLIRVAIASSSIPIIFGSEGLYLNGSNQEITIQDIITSWLQSGSLDQLPENLELHRSWDGGIRDTLPLQAAIGADADKIIAISASPRFFPEDSRFSGGSNRSGLFDALLRMADIMSNEISESDRLHSSEVSDITFIDSEFLVHDSITIDPGLIRINYEYGYMRAYNALEGVPDRIANFKDGSLVERIIYFLWVAAAFLATEEITALRREIWELENPRNWGWDIFTNIFPGLPGGGLVWDPGVLALIRYKKQQLFDLYKLRVEVWGTVECLPYPLPDGTSLEDSYLQWERRTVPFDAVMRNAPGPFERQRITFGPFDTFETWEDPDGIPAAPGPLQFP